MITELNASREGWKSGPWDSEQDTYVWKDEKTGYPCHIRRNTLGAFCGYVGVPDTHPSYGDIEAYEFDVHGGITYTNKSKDAEEDVWVLGFDCSHLGDALPTKKIFNDEGDVYRDFEYVKENVTSLAEQLYAKDPFNSLIESMRNEII